MEKINKEAGIINKIFETLNIILDETEINFETNSELINKLSGSLELARTLNIRDAKDELWSAVTGKDKKKEINQLIDNKFEQLLSWKYNLKEISEFNDVVYKVIDSFLARRALIKRGCAPDSRMNFITYYTEIGYRLFKAAVDLDKVRVSLLARAENESGNEHVELHLADGNKLPGINMRLHPGKRAEFAHAVSKMHDQQYFVPVKPAMSLSKEDILTAFGALMQVSLELNESVLPEPVQTVETVLPDNRKSFADYLLHAQKQKLAIEIKKEFCSEKSKSLRYLLEAMELHEPPLITIIAGEKKALYESMRAFFPQNIGSYNSIFQCNFNPKDTIEQQNIEKYIKRIDHLLDKPGD